MRPHKNKKIVILTGGVPSERLGGAEIAAIQTAEQAAKMGYEMHVVAASCQSEGRETINNMGSPYTIHRLKTVRARYLHGLVFAPKAARTVLRLNPDLIHVQSMYVAAGALIAHKLTRVPYLFYERGGISLPWVFNRLFYTLFLKNAERIIAQTATQGNVLRQYAGDRPIEVIPNGVNIDRFGNLGQAEARRMLGFPLDKKMALMVGRLRPEKNVRGFISAALRHDTLYVVVGDGPQLRLLQKVANGKVMFIGAVDNDKVPLYLSAADVMVNPSYSEGFPMAVLEAMASGKPIVAPPVCGIPELITEGINGLLTESNNTASIAVAIGRILDDRCLAQSMAEANKLKVRQYTWEAVVRRLYG